MKLIDYTREQVKAMAQSGLMNIKSTDHWDVCVELANGKTHEQIAELLHIHVRTVAQVKRTKCDCSW